MTQPFMPDDLILFNDLGQLDASRTRRAVACVVRSVDLGKDDYRSKLWLFAAGEEGRPVTTGPASDSAPRWSPDGSTLAFVSAREEGAPQVQLLSLAGGEARALTRLDEGASQFEWSPDGRRLFVLGAVGIDPESRGQGRRSQLKPEAPELAWRLPFKSDGSGYILQRAFVLWAVDAQTGAARQITPPRFDVLSAHSSPDGQRVAIARTREGDEAHRTDLWTLDAQGGNARQLTDDHASVMSPRWSPDGRWIAFCGAREEGDAQTRLYLISAEGGEPREIGGDDLEVGSVESLQWLPDSSAVLLVMAHRACQWIVTVSVPEGRMRPLVTGERHIAEVSLGPGRLYYFAEGADSPRELYTCEMDGTGERQVSHLNTWWWDRTPIDARIREFRVPDGNGGDETIEAWVVRAKGSHGPQPLLVEAHGGPNAFALLGFPWNTYWNTLVSRGWTIAVPHAAGSSSFGREFAERLNGRWGELDFPQFMAVIDALQRDGTASDQLVIAGKSYGGYMAAWAVGHTDRFKAAIVAAPVANLESHFGTSDGGYYSQPYVLAAERHIDQERYRRLSPVSHIQRCTTPTLILQGKEDERCPRGQSEELFAVLRRAGRAEAEMVMYPGGGHHFFETGKPSHRLDVVRRMTRWIERWTARREDGRAAAD